MVMFGPYVLAVHETVPAKTAAELIAYAKANPGKLAVANSGVGGANHITAVVMQKELGIQFKHVPYKGGAAATRAGSQARAAPSSMARRQPFPS